MNGKEYILTALPGEICLWSFELTKSRWYSFAGVRRQLEAEAGSREEMDLKLATFGLEAEWSKTDFLFRTPVRKAAPCR